MGGILWILGIALSAAVIMYGMSKGEEIIMLVGFILLPAISLSAIKAFAKTESHDDHSH